MLMLQEREVLEETGVATSFVTLLAFRHLHQFRHDCDDIYFISVLRVDGEEEDVVIRKQDTEIAKCEWQDIDGEWTGWETAQDGHMFITSS